MNYQAIKAKRRAGEPITREDLKEALKFEINAYRDNVVRCALASGEYHAAVRLSPLPLDEATKELSTSREAVGNAHIHISKLVYWLHKLESGLPIISSRAPSYVPPAPSPIEGEEEEESVYDEGY